MNYYNLTVSMKRLRSGSAASIKGGGGSHAQAGNGKKKKKKAPLQLRQRFSIAPLCFQASSPELNSEVTQRGAALKVKDNEKVAWREELLLSYDLKWL